MGVFEVSVTARNWLARYLPPDQRGEEIVCEALVDTGAVQAAFPADLIERLGLVEMDHIRAYTADGGVHEYRIMGVVEMEVQGRLWSGRVIELPRGARPLLGAIPLEEMDWHVSPNERRLIPNPRSPEGPLLPLVGLSGEG